MSRAVDILIAGGGIVGLAIALEAKRRQPGASILVVEKERVPGLHSSGRNSGVLHSGIYYPPDSLKAQACRDGSREWLTYCGERRLAVSRIGKLLLPTVKNDGPALDLLAARGASNGVCVERLDEDDLARREPEARSATGEALFVPVTSVVEPLAALMSIVEDARRDGVELEFDCALTAVDQRTRSAICGGERIAFGHAVNAAGLHADTVAHMFGAGRAYALLPFRGAYWKLDPSSGIRLNHLIYPVPDLRVPFLGIHTTTALDGAITLGPSALPALGRENYAGLEGVRPGDLTAILIHLARQFVSGRDGFRTLALNELRHSTRTGFARAAQAIIPRLRPEHLLPCAKVGIRAQMLDRKKRRLVTDFVVETGAASTHVINAISPAFTSAFPLARHVCDRFLDP